SVTPTRRCPATRPHTAASITNAPPRHPSNPPYAPTTNKSSQTTLSRETTSAIRPGRSRSSTTRMKPDSAQVRLLLGEHWPRRDERDLPRVFGADGRFAGIATEGHATADPGVPATSWRAGRANANGLAVAAAGGLGRPAGQHAESRAALLARAGRRGRLVDAGGSVAGPA